MEVMSQEDANVPKNVEECPPPPRYYLQFANEDHFIDPPAIPEESNSLYGQVYGGLLPKIKEKTLPFNPTRNYGQDIKM